MNEPIPFPVFIIMKIKNITGSIKDSGKDFKGREYSNKNSLTFLHMPFCHKIHEAVYKNRIEDTKQLILNIVVVLFAGLSFTPFFSSNFLFTTTQTYHGKGRHHISFNIFLPTILVEILIEKRNLENIHTQKLIGHISCQ